MTLLRRSSWAAVSGVTLLTASLMMGLPAQAVSEAGDVVTFSVLGDLAPAAADGVIEPAELEPLGVTDQEIALIEEAIASDEPTTVEPDEPVEPDAPVAPVVVEDGSEAKAAPVATSVQAAASGYDILSSWNDRDGRLVNYRRTASGKVAGHNPTRAAAQRITQSPGEILPPLFGNELGLQAASQ